MEWEGRVVSAHHKLASVEERMNSGKFESTLWKHYDEEFHQALISNCESQELMDTHRTVFDKYFRYPLISADRRGAEPIKQHRELLECALARDAARAKTVLVAHVRNCVDYTLESGALARFTP
jgi:DNA-binding GntR family transcriptional regulator